MIPPLTMYLSRFASWLALGSVSPNGCMSGIAVLSSNQHTTDGQPTPPVSTGRHASPHRAEIGLNMRSDE